MRINAFSSLIVCLCGIAVAWSEAALAAPGEVLSHVKISDTEGGFGGILDDEDRIGRGLACVGDVDQDGINDLVVG